MISAIIISHLFILLLGFPILRCLVLREHCSRLNHCFVLGLSYLTGELAVVLLLLWSSAFGGSFNWWAVYAALPLLWLCLLITERKKFITKTRKVVDALFAPANVAVLVFILVLSLPFAATSFTSPLIAWDARSIWFFHGKVFFFDGGISPELLKNQLYLWSHPEYPPFIPLLSVFHAHFLGEWSEVLNKSFLFVHWYFALLSFYYVLRALKVQFEIASLMTITMQVVFGENAYIGYADSNYGMFFLLAAGCLARSLVLAGREKKDLSIAYLLLAIGCFAISSLTKQEGLYFSLLYLLIATVYTFIYCRSFSRQMLFGLLLFLASAANWYGYCAIVGIKGEYSFAPQQILFAGFGVVADRLSFIVSYIFTQTANFHGYSALALILAALLLPCYLIYRKTSSRLLRLLLLPILTSLLLLPFSIVLIYLSSPLDLEWHLFTSYERLITVVMMLSLLPLAILWAQLPKEHKK